MKAIRADLFKRDGDGKLKGSTAAIIASPRSWCFDYHHNGRPYRDCSLDNRLRKCPDARWPDGHVASLKDAETYTDECKQVIRDGKWHDKTASAAPPVVKAEGLTPITFEAFVVAWATSRQKTGLTSWNNDPGMLRQVGLATLADGRTVNALPLVDVTGDVILEAFERTAGMAHGTRKKYKGALGRACKWAVKKKYLAASPLVAEDLEWPTIPKGKIRMVRLTPEVVARLVDCALADTRDRWAGQRVADMIEAATITGCRHGELTAIKLDECHERALDAPADVLSFVEVTALEPGAHKSGYGKGRIVPSDDTLDAIIRRRRAALATSPRGGQAFLFGDEDGARVESVERALEIAACGAYGIPVKWTGSGGDLTPATRAALKAINGGEGLWWTDIRHTAALRWHEQHVELNAIAEMLGHADLAMLRVYLKISGLDALKAHARAFAKPAAPTPPAQANRSKPEQTGRSLKLVKRAKVG